MRLTAFLFLAASNLFLSMATIAATRPHYGGTLHLQMRSAPASLDPADAQPDCCESRNLYRLLFDTLVSLDAQGRPQPALASSWQAEPGNQRWRFFMRGGVRFGDGSLLTPDIVAASLRRANPAWKVFSEGEAVVIERSSPAHDLPIEMSLSRNSAVKRDGGKIYGTGPFNVSQWDPGKKLILTRREDYWASSAFLDAIEIEFGKNLREQLISFDLGKAQVIEIAPEQAHRAIAEGRQVKTSSPMELVAVLFSRDSQSPQDEQQRRAFALSIDREALNTVVLQSGGEPAGALLPNWMTGYEFLFPAAVNLTLARQLRNEIAHTTAWTLSYDSADPAARVIAERIVLNARDAGLGVQINTASNADLRLVRIPLISLDAQMNLTDLAAMLGLPDPNVTSGSMDDLYLGESMLLQSHRVVPLLHLRTAVAVSNTVKNWRTARDGSWDLPNTWLVAETP
jgi:peptide/nickel transport system substrate-binding protein